MDTTFTVYTHLFMQNNVPVYYKSEILSTGRGLSEDRRDCQNSVARMRQRRHMQ